MDISRFDAFMPHGMCYMWQWDMVLLQVGSDLLIALAYFSIPAAMIVLLRNRPDMPRGIFKLFVSFIMLCGITHLIGVVVVWQPIYLIQGIAKLATAIVSIITAVVLWPLIPKAIAMPSVNDLEARNAKIDALNKRLQERLESLSTLAGGVSHEFNNLLTVIYGNVELLQDDITSAEDQEKLRAIKTASRRCTDICSKMLAYSGNGHFVLEEFDLGNFIESSTIHVSDKCSLTMQIQKNLPPIMGSPKQVKQVLNTLIENAHEAVDEKTGKAGNIGITVGKAELSSADIAEAAFETDAKPGPYVFLEVSDDGIGMDSSIMERVFDPYFSTKFTGRGLGMAAVQGIVRGHDGCLFLQSSIGNGSLVRVAFPAAQASSEQYQAPRNPQPQLVLVVDDEEPLLQIARNYLEEMGLQVLTAKNADEAIEMVKQYGHQIDAVIVDYLMPEVTGLQLLERMSDLLYADKYLTSGFTRGEIGDPDIRSQLTGFIAKPFSREDIQALFGGERQQEKKTPIN